MEKKLKELEENKPVPNVRPVTDKWLDDKIEHERGLCCEKRGRMTSDNFSRHRHLYSALAELRELRALLQQREKALEQAVELAGLRLGREFVPNQTETPEVREARLTHEADVRANPSRLFSLFGPTYHAYRKAMWDTMPTVEVILWGRDDSVERTEYEELAAYLKEKEGKK